MGDRSGGVVLSKNGGEHCKIVGVKNKIKREITKELIKIAKLNWNKVNQQNLVHKKGYEDRSGEISPYQQCTEKQYQLIEKLINQSPKNIKLAKQFLFWDTKTNKLLPRKMLTKKYASILIDKIINN